MMPSHETLATCSTVLWALAVMAGFLVLSFKLWSASNVQPENCQLPLQYLP